MLVLLGVTLTYLFASLPGLAYALSKIEADKATTRFSQNESTRIVQYLEFYQLWYVLFFELIKVILFLMVITGENPFVFTAFLAGIVAPFWRWQPFRDASLYVFLFLLVTQFPLGIIYAAIWVFMSAKTRDLLPYLNISCAGLVALIFWVTSAEILLVLESILLMIAAGLMLAFPKRTQ